jgi:translation initiation factor 2 subunit 1
MSQNTMNPALQCANLNDIVEVEIIAESDMGIYVRLPNNNNIEGHVLMSEIYSRRNPSKKIKNKYCIGKKVLAKIIRIDKEKGYIDLSIRQA